MSDQAVTTASTTGAAGAAAGDAGNGNPAGITTAAGSTTNANQNGTPANGAAGDQSKAGAAASAASTTTTDAGKASAAADVALTMPQDALLPAAALAEVQAFAKEHGINAKAAQAILDGRNAAVVANRQADEAAYTKLVQGWENEIKADKEMGGDSYDANTALMDKTLKSFASEQFLKDLESSGLIHQPEFRRFLLRVGKSGAEDGLSAARTSANQQSHQASEDAALKARYPSMYANAG